MLTFEKTITSPKDVLQAYLDVIEGKYELYAFIGRKGRYGYKNGSHFLLTPSNSVPYKNKLFATSPFYVFTGEIYETDKIEPTTEPHEHSAPAEVSSQEEADSIESTITQEIPQETVETATNTIEELKKQIEHEFNESSDVVAEKSDIENIDNKIEKINGMLNKFESMIDELKTTLQL